MARIAALTLLLAAACSSGSGSAATTATPAVNPNAPVVGPAGDVERATFSPSLGVDLSKMIRRPSGLYVQDFETGTGAVAASGRTAVVRYEGYLSDGKKFDAGEITITLGTNKVIKAWEDGVLGMRVGGKRRLVSPPHLAYGTRGSPPVIPPSAVLVFDMELMQVY
jgi:peptidylprolyl isomerase